jgi:hypothetical protein
MSYTQYPVSYTASKNVSHLAPHAGLAMGGLGAIIGGTAAAAKNIRRVKNEEIDREEAVRDTLKETAGAGIAAATAAVVVRSVGATGLFGLVGIMAVAAGAKYVWDSAMTPKTAKNPAPGKASGTKTGKAKK